MKKSYEFDDDEIRKWLSMSVDELKELKRRDDIKLDQLQAKLDAENKRHVELTRKYEKVTNDVNKIQKRRAKATEKALKLQENKNLMQAKLNNLDEELVGITAKYQEARIKVQDVKKMYEEKCLSIRGTREEFKTHYNKLEDEIKQAEIDLSHKKDSLTANQQVLESKIACLAKDEEDCEKLTAELKLLTEKNHRGLLKEMQQKEQDMKLEYSDLCAKMNEYSKNMDNLDSDKSSLTTEIDKLSLDLAVEEKCNKKLEAELKNETEGLEKTAMELVTAVANAIHCDNLNLAKILRDDLIKFDENSKEIQSLEQEKADIEKQNLEFDALKEQKLEQLNKIKTDVIAKIEEKVLIEKQLIDFKNFLANKKEIEQTLKTKVAEKEEALKKHEASKKKTAGRGTQLTAGKGTQMTVTKPSQPKAAESKTPKTARPKGKKNKEPPVTKVKESAPIATKSAPIAMDTNDGLQQNIFSSSSSSEANLSYDFSSSLNGSKPDIMQILANLSDNKFGLNDTTSHRSSGM